MGWCTVTVALMNMKCNYNAVIDILEQSKRFVKEHSTQSHCDCGGSYGCNCGKERVFLLLGRIEGTILALKMLNEDSE